MITYYRRYVDADCNSSLKIYNMAKKHRLVGEFLQSSLCNGRIEMRGGEYSVKCSSGNIKKGEGLLIAKWPIETEKHIKNMFNINADSVRI